MQIFPGGACPQTPLANALRALYFPATTPPNQSKFASYGPVLPVNVVTIQETEVYYGLSLFVARSRLTTVQPDTNRYALGALQDTPSPAL